MVSYLRVVAWRVYEHSRKLILHQRQYNKAGQPVQNLNYPKSLIQSNFGLKPSSNISGRGPSSSSGSGANASQGPGTISRLFGRFSPYFSTVFRRIVHQRNFNTYRYVNSAPLFALVGVSLVSVDDEENGDKYARYRGLITKDQELEALCLSIREAASQTSQLYDSPATVPSDAQCSDDKGSFSTDDLEFSDIIGTGCNAVVYGARFKCNDMPTDGENENDNLAQDIQTEQNLKSQAGPSRSKDFNLNLSSSNSNLARFNQYEEIQSNILPQFSSTPDLSSSSLLSNLTTYSSDSDMSTNGNLYDCDNVISSPSFSPTICNETLQSILSKGRFSNAKANKRSVRFEYLDETEESNTKSDKEEELPEPCTNKSDINSSAEYPLAVKLVFNYEAASNAPAVLSALYRELIPARVVKLDQLYTSWRNSFFGESDSVLLPYHPNIVDMPCAFVDRTPLLKGGLNEYPSALPPRLNPQGVGRNMSLFCVMKRYDLSLDAYLSKHPNLSPRTSLLLLTQLMEALLHLSSHNISHRDLKPDNILISLVDGWDSPWLVLTDFGCCLAADNKRGLLVHFSSRESEPRQGNMALMAPEVKSARPGLLNWIDFTKCDLWAAGSLAYQIYGQQNPFLKSDESAKPLDSSTYKESQLPTLPRASGAPPAIRRLVSDLLRKKQCNRPEAVVAATICQLSLWGPNSWLNRHSLTRPKHQQVMEWLLCLTAKIICEKRRETRGNGVTEHRIINTFLSRVTYSDVIAAINWNRAF